MSENRSDAGGELPRVHDASTQLHQPSGIITAEEAATGEKRALWLHYVFVGPDGLRPGWGILLFILIFATLGKLTTTVMHALNPHPALSAAQSKAEEAKPQEAAGMLRSEGISFALIALATWIMGRIERRPAGSYGLGGPHKLGRFLAGFVWGLVFLAALVGALWKGGLLVFDARLQFGTAALRYGLIWLLGFMLVGLLEEYLLRGYLQYTMARGAASLYRMLFNTTHAKALGFWTAAAFLSFVFGFGHGNNPGESPIGLLSAGLIGLIFCLTLWRTGSLWWAVGFHASWDWAQSFLFGVADSGMLVEGRFVQSHPIGKVLLSGGATGPEGSALILPLLVLITAVAWTLRREGRWTAEELGSILPNHGNYMNS